MNMADMTFKEEFKVLKQVMSAESAESSDIVNDFYNKWADSYDKEVSDNVTYNGPFNAAWELAQRLGSNKDVHILDLGAGTGLVATELAKLGLTRVDALDANKAMLEVARKKSLYQKYIHGYLGTNMDIPTDNYDALICTGTFGHSQADETCFDELIRITKPGGFIVITMSDYPDMVKQMNKRISELESLGLWKLLNPGAISKSHSVRVTGITTGTLYTLQIHE